MAGQDIPADPGAPLERIAEVARAAAPADPPWEWLRVELRFQGDSSQDRYFSEAVGRAPVRFDLPRMAAGRPYAGFVVLAAMREIDAAVAADAAYGVSRARLTVERSGVVTFVAHDARRMFDALAAALRRSWPDGVERLRLTVRYDSFGRHTDAWESVWEDGRCALLDAVPPDAPMDNDTTRRVVEDIWCAARAKPTLLRIELERRGPFQLTLE